MVRDRIHRLRRTRSRCSLLELSVAAFLGSALVHAADFHFFSESEKSGKVLLSEASNSLLTLCFS